MRCFTSFENSLPGPPSGFCSWQRPVAVSAGWARLFSYRLWSLTLTHCFKVSSGLVTNTSFLGSLLFSYRGWEQQIRFTICLQNDCDDSFVAQQCGGRAGPCGSCSVISLSITGSGSRGWFLPNMLVAHWEMSLHAQNKCNFPWGWSLALSDRCTLWTPPAPFCSETQL